jgi:hypothetical protein
MPPAHKRPDQAIREAAYFIWEREGRPHGRHHDHWRQALAGPSQTQPDDEHLEDEEKVLDGRHDANIPAMLTKDVPGG